LTICVNTKASTFSKENWWRLRANAGEIARHRSISG
jgi:hypothetical protein